jgi:ATP-dependent Clp protease ATP-binding subunit ClpC
MMQLDKEDIESGVQWFAHVRRMVERAHEKSHYGGIGRDLSFGWAPVLNYVGYNITADIQRGGYLRRPVDSRQETIDQLFRLLSQPGKRNAVLVGEPGVGKTTLVFSAAQRLITAPHTIPSELQYQQIITLDAGHLIANAKGRGQLEELLIQIFNEAVRAKNVVLFLDEAQLFLKDATGSVDLSSLLLPVIQGGALKIILSLNEQEWLRLSQEKPGLAQLMNRVVVKPLDKEETIQVVEDETILLEGRNNLTYMHQAINEAYKLADRFIHEQAFPGKAIKLLEAAANFPEQTYFVSSKSVRQAVEKSFDVKVQTADSTDERTILLNLEDKIHERMINQTRAVKLVSDALRRARSGVRNENKPIGTFLFLGPTGVGKTELSKALANVYFGGEERLVRLDLNEFSHAEDTSRLLAVGANDPYSLCAQIAKQPFSVVLLDEIEKAHQNVLNVLLQMLDEGILRDSANKPISFRDAIIIATSNAGAERIRQHIEAGQALEQFEEGFVDELINANVFRPEFLNRFDEIVLFRPLSKQELVQVVDLLIARLNSTLADRKISVRLTVQAKELLAERGYDPRLGARPLRRVVQRAVENVVAQKLLANEAQPGQTLELDASELHMALEER